MHIAPQPHKCVKCGYEFNFSPDNFHPAPVFNEDVPTCPKCWVEFLSAIGFGLSTIPWSKNGSEYDQYMKDKK